MATTRDRKAWTQILQLYHKEYPYLWDKKNSMYSNKMMRNNAYKILTQIYRENFDAEATVDIVKKKLENMRTTYFRELRKVRKSVQIGEDEIYEPSLWYYKDLNFLSDIYDSRGRYYTGTNNTTANDPLKTEDTFDISSNSDQEYEPSTSQGNTSKRSEYKKTQKFNAFKKQEQDIDEEQQSADQKPTRNCDDWDVIGRSIGLQLRNITDKQLTIASKLISDSIYFAKLNRLSEESHIEIGTTISLPTICDMCGSHVGN